MALDVKELNSTRNLLLSFNTRLIERQLYLAFFEGLSHKQLIKAILSYQNDDGGFGNGIEPDLTTPESTAIGLETALYYFDCIAEIPDSTTSRIVSWIAAQLGDTGVIEHPTPKLLDYPHQSWWKNKDDYRILAITGLLRKLKVDLPPKMIDSIYQYAQDFTIPDQIEEYDYPIFLFSLYCTDFSRRDEALKGLQQKIIDLNARKPNLFILFSRYWKFFNHLIEKQLVDRESQRVFQTIKENGLLPSLYEGLPWWDPIFTLDSLIALGQYHSD